MLKGILAITGQPGLYRLTAEAKNRIIVESLITGKKMPVSSSAKISSLEDIAVYTRENDMPLKEVFKRISIQEAGGQAIDAKAPASELKKYFSGILPDYDENRVYVSDIKKVILWYNILNEQGLLDFGKEEETSDTDTDPEEVSE